MISLMDPLFRNVDLTHFLSFFAPFSFHLFPFPFFPFVVKTPHLKGFGYVTFKDKDGLLKALKMTGLNMGGRNLRVEVAKPQRGGNRRGESSCAISCGT